VIDDERRKAMKPQVLLAAEAYEIYAKGVNPIPPNYLFFLGG
jgi:hypothetical protein